MEAQTNGQRIQEIAENNVFKLATRGLTAIALPVLGFLGWGLLSDVASLKTQVAVMSSKLDLITTDRYTASQQATYAEFVSLRFQTLEHRVEQLERKTSLSPQP